MASLTAIVVEDAMLNGYMAGRGDEWREKGLAHQLKKMKNHAKCAIDDENLLDHLHGVIARGSMILQLLRERADDTPNKQ